jgi:hypothetical protein
VYDAFDDALRSLSQSYRLWILETEHDDFALWVKITHMVGKRNEIQ